MNWLLALLWVVISVVFFFTAYQFLFFVVSIFSDPLGKRNSIRKDHLLHKNFGIIIPAHNEEILIGGLIKSIHALNYSQEKVTIYVIADNCTDKTAEIASELGAVCRIRNNQIKKGKPYALHWLISNIDLNSHDAYVIIDADTIVDPDFLIGMNRALSSGHKVIQGYFGVMNPDENWLTRLSILPGILKFYLHFPAKKRLKLSCPLAGNGMCFDSSIFKKYGWNAFSIAENWEYYIQLTLDNYLVWSEQGAVIYSQVANSLKSGVNQRQRWQSGRINTLARYWKKLLKYFLVTRNFVTLDALVELLRPSHSILLFSSLTLLVFTGLHYYFDPDKFSSLMIVCLLILFMQLSYFISGLIIQKAPIKTWLSLFMVPFYLVWKFIISLQILGKHKDKKWIKTERH